MSKKGFGRFAIGAAIGTGLGLLFAPKKGEETRKELKKKIDELIESAKEIDTKEVKDNFDKKVQKLQADLKDLDKETALKIAKEKGEKIADEASKLVDMAVEAGKPMVEEAAEEVRKKAVKVTKDVLKKLEKEEKKA